jgi:hypothetical protein
VTHFEMLSLNESRTMGRNWIFITVAVLGWFIFPQLKRNSLKGIELIK